MFITIRGLFVRNVAVSIINGAITLTLLLIAPLGLAAVISNTAMVTVSTFVVATGLDFIVAWLLRPSPGVVFPPQSRRDRRLSRDEEMRR